MVDDLDLYLQNKSAKINIISDDNSDDPFNHCFIPESVN